jgi:FkbM family methyltransferase
MGFSLKRWILSTLTRREIGVSQLDWKYLKISYSQFGEDLILSSLLTSPTGLYVDVGAYHPVQISNTYLLYRRGWRGLVIDANPEVFASFRQRRPRDLLVHAAVGDRTGEASFEVHWAGPSSRLAPDPDVRVDAKVKKLVRVPLRTLAAILDEHLPPSHDIDYLNVDCEGADLGVLRSNNWKKYRPKVITVEDLLPRGSSEICRLLRDHGYEIFAETGITRLFCAPDLLKQWTDRIV